MDIHELKLRINTGQIHPKHCADIRRMIGISLARFFAALTEQKLICLDCNKPLSGKEKDLFCWECEWDNRT